MTPTKEGTVVTDQDWTPSDYLLARDPFALAKVADPDTPTTLSVPGDDAGDEANAASAAVALAELADNEDTTESGDAADDDHIDDHDDPAVLEEI